MSARDQVPDAPVQRLTPPTLDECRLVGDGELVGLYQFGRHLRWLAVYSHPRTGVVTVYDVKHGKTSMSEDRWLQWAKRLNLHRVPLAGREKKLLATAAGQSAEDELIPKALRRITLLRRSTLRPQRTSDTSCSQQERPSSSLRPHGSSL